MNLLKIILKLFLIVLFVITAIPSFLVLLFLFPLMDKEQQDKIREAMEKAK